MPLNLNNPKVLEAIKWQAEQIFLFDLSEKARQIVLNLPKMLVEVPIERAEDQFAYQDILVRAKFIALPILSDGEIVELMQSSFVQIFEMPGYDLWKKLKTKLITLPQFEDRDNLKKRIREALLMNDQVLTKETMFLDNKSVKGTVKNWLTDYHRSLGTGEVEALKLSQHLISGVNTKNLSGESRKKLEYLLKIYEKLKVSSAKIQAVEESMIFNVEGELDFFVEGVAEKIGREIKEVVKRLEGLEEILEVKNELEAKYKGSEEKLRMVEDEKKKILKITKGDFKKLAGILYKVVNAAPGKASNKISAEAVLKILSEQGELENLLEEKEFNEMMASYLREKGRITDLDGFKVNPRAPQYVSIFLQYILKDKIGLTEDESGRIGMQLFNLLMKKGADLESREFRWS